MSSLAEDVKDQISGQKLSVSVLCSLYDEAHPDEIITSHDPLSITFVYEDCSKLILAEKDGSVYYEVDNSDFEGEEDQD